MPQFWVKINTPVSGYAQYYQLSITHLKNIYQFLPSLLHNYPVHIFNLSGPKAMGFLHHKQTFDVLITFFNYDLKSVIMTKQAQIKQFFSGGAQKI